MTEGRWDGRGCPQEGRLQESETQFGSPRAAGPSDEGLGEARGGPWTRASPVRAEGEGRQGALGEGSWGEGGTRTAAACGSEARGLPGCGDVGRKTPLRSRGEASSFTVQMRSFQGHVCTGPAGCVCVSVSACVGVCAGGGRQGRPRASPSGPLPARAAGSSPAPAPPPHCGAATAAAPAPTARGGDREEPGTTTPLCAAGTPRGGVPPRRVLSLAPPPLPDPSAPRTPSHRWPEEDRGAALPAPGGLPGPPPRGAEEGRAPGGGAGGRVVPGCHFLPPPRSLRGARPPPPPSLPRAAAGADPSGSGSAPSGALAAGSRRGRGAGAEPGRRGRPGRGPCGSAEPGTAAEAGGGGAPRGIV